MIVISWLHAGTWISPYWILMNKWVDWLCLAWCVGGYHDELYILYSGTILRGSYTTGDLTTTAVDSK